MAKPRLNLQQLVLGLQNYWADYGCAIVHPYDVEKGAGTFHPATFLRSLGPEPWRAAYVEPSRRPTDGRYGDNPNRVQRFYQFQVIVKPAPDDSQDIYLESLRRLGIDLDPVSLELTYGIERIGMFLQDVPDVFRLEWAPGLLYGEMHHEDEVQFSRYNFDVADTDMLFRLFDVHEAECRRCLAEDLPLPAVDQMMKCSHTFNLLDARGAVSVAERTSYIKRVRDLASAIARGYVALRERLGHPLLPPGAHGPCAG